MFSRRPSRLAYRMGLEPAYVFASTLSNTYISKAGIPVAIKLEQKKRYCGGVACIRFFLFHVLVFKIFCAVGALCMFSNF